jgi:hypothetical protein
MKLNLKDIEKDKFPKFDAKHVPPKASERAKSMDEVFHEILNKTDRRQR